VPDVFDSFQIDDTQILLLKWIEGGERNKTFWKIFGEQLAALHSHTQDKFGLDHDNYMGSVDQKNDEKDNWIIFFGENRLQPLMKKCLDANLLSTGDEKLFYSLIQKLSNFFDEHEKPSLQHGDLWSGNFMCDEESKPVLIDPAVYYGHRSIDLGMTTLFGGFPQDFYDSYSYHTPFESNYREQWEISNLYPLLIHLLLFGKSYLPSIQSILKKYS
jgi:fructosamine-3-kinase